jgi:D-alanyl-D-alanine carboxypeptidase
MNASNLERKLSFKSKVISKAEKFNRKHKRLSFLGMAYVVLALTGYDIMSCFSRNSTRLLALTCILLFFVSSSSFSYPAMSLNISFASNGTAVDSQQEQAQVLSQEVVAESDAELIKATSVDASALADDGDNINPDVAEIDDMVSGADILGDVDYTDLTAYENTDDAKEDVKDNAGSLTSFKKDDWKLILVNKQHPIPDDYQFVLGEISSGMKCDERVIKPLYEMLKAAKADGVSLIVCSPYRDLDRQTMLFGNKVKNYMNNGMSYMDAYKLASQAVTVPGSSEHQIGLAVDIITDGYSTLDEGFGETKAGKWLAENSADYGFILRYPAGKEEITSIEYEPWHFRYVGVDAAKVITDNGMCLEEFWNKYVE